MPTFKYKAQKTNGETYEGTLEAKDRFDVYSYIKRNGEVVLSVKEEQEGKTIIDTSKINVFLSRVKESEKILLTRNLYAMLSAGLSLVRALSVIERQTKNPKLKDIIQKLSEDVRGGSAFNTALEKFPGTFSKLVSSMVKAGEESGKLSDALSTISHQMEQAYNLKKKIQGALIYPAIVLIALVIIGILMLLFIVPTLKDTFDDIGAELPASTQFIIDASNFLVNQTLLALSLIVLVVVLFIAILRTKRGTRAFEWLMLHTPVISTLVKETNSARTARTLSSLLSSGVEVVTAFNITQDVVQNYHYKDVLKDAEKRVQKGEAIHVVFEEYQNLYPVFVSELIAVGEETGKLPDMLSQIATFYEGEVEQKTKDMSTIVEPFLMIVVGAVVGFFAISMISPIYSITGGI